MPRSMKQPTAEPSIVQQWEDARTVLDNAVLRFCDLSMRLEKHCTTWGEPSSNIDLADRIDMSLNYLQSTLDQQLTPARVALSKTRNRISQSILCLPKEILWEIFQHAVYDPTDDDNPAVIMSTERRAAMIYPRLYSLLGVCALWRGAGIACSVLWSVVPLADPDLGHLRSQLTRVSLERTGLKGLHLVALPTMQAYLKTECLPAYISRFNSVSIYQNSRAGDSFSHILKMFLDPGTGTPALLSNLCLDNHDNSLDQGARPVEKPTRLLSSHCHGLESQLSQIIRSLSRLRLMSLSLEWGRTTFSNRLVLLQIGKISLGRQPRIDAFISALQSAQELRDLTLISIRAIIEENEVVAINSLALPNLKLLHIEDIYCNLFDHFMQVLAPGDYHLTVNLYPTFSCAYILPAYSGYAKMVNMADGVLYDILRPVEIHKLILSANDPCPWEWPEGVRKLLKAVPTLKTLVLNHYDLDRELLKALRPPPRPLSWESTRDDLFPKLETVEFHCCSIKSPLKDLKNKLKALRANHPVQRLVLGICRGSDESELFLDEDDEVISWLKANIPEFRLFRKQEGPPEMIRNWELWGI